MKECRNCFRTSSAMTYDQPHNEIETGVIAVGVAYAASLMGLIIWLA